MSEEQGAALDSAHAAEVAAQLAAGLSRCSATTPAIRLQGPLLPPVLIRDDRDNVHHLFGRGHNYG